MSQPLSDFRWRLAPVLLACLSMPMGLHAETLAQAKALMRLLINHRLDYQPLRSRRIFRELLEM